MSSESYDAIVIGSGPNGLAAGIELARAGLRVLLREGAATLGGSMRSAAATLPGFVHDICSTVHALPRISPFFRSCPLEKLGVEFIYPPAEFAHPLDDGAAAVCHRSVEDTAAGLSADGDAYRKLFSGLSSEWEALAPALLAPPRLPAHPILMARFGLAGIRSARIGRDALSTAGAKALFAGVAAHATLPLEWKATAAFGMVLTLAAHGQGWPIVKGGSQRLADALANYFRSLGGTIISDAPVDHLDDLPPSKAVLCDLTPRQLLKIAGDRLPGGYRRRLERYRYGPGVFKIDYALSDPIPWTAAACARAGTVHVGGTLEDIAVAEAAPWAGRHADRPFVLVVQPATFDPSRAPAGRHIGWAYCHVPNGSTMDMTELIERQIERFAPGFRDTILAKSTMNTAAMERYNPNLVGGDINGGAQDLSQLFTRPLARLDPYSTPVKGLYLCSSSTPPGGGVHGMCGYFAARSALRREFGVRR